MDLPTKDDFKSDRNAASLATTLEYKIANIYQFSLPLSIPFRVFFRDFGTIEPVCDDCEQEYIQQSLDTYNSSLYLIILSENKLWMEFYLV